jgi:hypothetical protein
VLRAIKPREISSYQGRIDNDANLLRPDPV